MAAAINNLLCCSAAVTTRRRNHLALSKFNTCAIPFIASSSFHLSTKPPSINRFKNFNLLLQAKTTDDYDIPTTSPPQNAIKKKSKFVVTALTIGVAIALLMDEKAAMALGPEGPLAEEFWENMRRYALYALTVSSGVAYAVFQPIYELLRNPISAILIIVIAVGAFYLVSQVLSAMVGVSDFTYQYSY